MAIQTTSTKEDTIKRLYELLELQKQIETEFVETNYNIFVFGSYLTTGYVAGVSDIDIAIYSENFSLYNRLALYLEAHFQQKGITADIFYIDVTMAAPIFCAPLNSKVQFTDYYPQVLIDFKQQCQAKLKETRERLAG